jgi:hypothetical protein
MVERLFDTKICAIQTDWGDEYQKLTPFLPMCGYLSSCLMPTHTPAE